MHQHPKSGTHHASPEPDSAFQDDFDDFQGFDGIDYDEMDDDLDEVIEPVRPPVLH